ncbi:TonB family protein [Parvularcula lutaonensis]|uniref:TonB family protein n=1 Tax=Parvularcula lutaonensis TaxID=491923 RepID=A0ABV7M6S2_9PROT|nr:TonB family protein [Parvularcula lutaonensis]GGY56442.1 hypothetical protein GCM10007148_27510 [Parvularcula lutaonensis]
MKRLLPALLLGACASSPPPTPVVSDPSAQPLRRVSPEGFEGCLRGKPLPYRGVVEVELETGPEGFVTGAEIVDSSDPCLNPSVLAAVQQWRYPPKMVDGVLAARTGIRALIVINAEDDE